MPSHSHKSSDILRFSDFKRKDDSAKGFRRFLRRQRDPDLDQLSKRILLPTLPVADEDMIRMTLHEAGRKFARQEDWAGLVDAVKAADAARRRTPGGTSEAMLLMSGANSDVVAASAERLVDRVRPDQAEVTALAAITREARPCHVRAQVVALAHIEIARAWQVNRSFPEAERATAIKAHVAQAETLLQPLDARALEAPALAMCHYMLAGVAGYERARLIASFEQARALDPDNTEHLRHFGRAINRLNDAALLHRLAETCAQGGAALYLWYYLDVLMVAPERMMEIDSVRFVQGLREVLSAGADQHIVNELAAFCALALPCLDTDAPQAKAAHEALHGALEWILEHHLRELHPRLWAGMARMETQPQCQESYRMLVSKGRKRALRSIAAFFADQMADGSSIAFSPAGMYRLPAI